jgi:hypothetical protein
MMAGKAAKVSRGCYGGGRPPFGWRAEGKELLPDEREQVVVALASKIHPTSEADTERALGGSQEPS